MRLWVPEWLTSQMASRLLSDSMFQTSQSCEHYRFPGLHLWGYYTKSRSQSADSSAREPANFSRHYTWIHCGCHFLTSLCLCFQAASSHSRVLDCPWHPGAHDDLHHQHLRMPHKAFTVSTFLCSPHNLLILQDLNWENALRNGLKTLGLCFGFL